MTLLKIRRGNTWFYKFYCSFLTKRQIIIIGTDRQLIFGASKTEVLNRSIASAFVVNLEKKYLILNYLTDFVLIGR